METQNCLLGILLSWQVTIIPILKSRNRGWENNLPRAIIICIVYKCYQVITDLWQLQQGASQRWFASAFLCRVFLGSHPRFGHPMVAITNPAWLLSSDKTGLNHVIPHPRRAINTWSNCFELLQVVTKAMSLLQKRDHSLSSAAKVVVVGVRVPCPTQVQIPTFHETHQVTIIQSLTVRLTKPTGLPWGCNGGGGKQCTLP